MTPASPAEKRFIPSGASDSAADRPYAAREDPTAAGGGRVCARCLAVHEPEQLVARLMVCPGCGHHGRLTARERMRFLVDASSLVEWDTDLAPGDPIGFVDERPYPSRLHSAQMATGEREAIVTGRATIRGIPIAIGVFEFGFMGGSMGSVVGEKIHRLFTRASGRGLPVLMVTASGGARMQEGTVALMQMAKVAVAISRFRERRLPYIALLADPTTGGVAASAGMLGDVILAEPGAQIGFAGPRVIEQTIRAPLPTGFQRAERLLEHGLLDAIIPRSELRSSLQDLLLALGVGPERGRAPR